MLWMGLSLGAIFGFLGGYIVCGWLAAGERYDLENERDLYKSKLKNIRKKYNEITQLKDREN